NAGASGTIDIAAAGDIAVGANLLAGTSLSLHSGTDGSGNLGFAGSPALRSASISLRAGDGAGGAGTTAAIDALTNTPSFTNFAGSAAPTIFTIRQDGALADGAIPAAAQFGGSSVSGMTYTLQSDDASVTLGTASKVAGSSLSISGATGVTVTPAISLDHRDRCGCDQRFHQRADLDCDPVRDRWDGQPDCWRCEPRLGLDFPAGRRRRGGNEHRDRRPHRRTHVPQLRRRFAPRHVLPP